MSRLKIKDLKVGDRIILTYVEIDYQERFLNKVMTITQIEDDRAWTDFRVGQTTLEILDVDRFEYAVASINESKLRKALRVE